MQWRDDTTSRGLATKADGLSAETDEPAELLVIRGLSIDTMLKRTLPAGF
jgi:hypothetical protein